MTGIVQNNLNPNYELASISRRFFAGFVDLIIITVIIFSVMHWYPYDESMRNAPYLENMASKSNVYHQIIYYLFHLLINYPFLRKGQNIGMKLLKIQVTDVYGKVASIWRMYFVRMIIFWIIINILRYSILYFLNSHYALNDNSIMLLILLLNSIGIVDLLFIYRKDHRCIHDFFAGTIVVRVH